MNLYLDLQQCVRRNHAFDAFVAICHVRTDLQSPFAANPHTFDPIEEPAKQELAVDAIIRRQCLTIRRNSVLVEKAKRMCPNYRIALVEPDSERHSVELVSLDLFPTSSDVFEDFDS